MLTKKDLSREMRSRILVLIRAGRLDLLPKAEPGSKQCGKCVHTTRKANPSEHCYMFLCEPAGDACGQFEERTT